MEKKELHEDVVEGIPLISDQSYQTEQFSIQTSPQLL